MLVSAMFGFWTLESRVLMKTTVATEVGGKEKLLEHNASVDFCRENERKSLALC